MPPGPHSQGETIPDHPNDLHKLKPPTNNGVSPTPLQGGVTNFLFNTFFFALGSDQHQHLPGCQPREISEQSQDAPQIEQKPQISQNATPQAKSQPPTPTKLLFDFSLIYTVLHKAGNKGELESPFSLELLLPKHYPAPQALSCSSVLPNGPEKCQVQNPQETGDQSC